MDTLSCLLPGEQVNQDAVDIMFRMAAAMLQIRVMADVRVVPGWTWESWLNWAGLSSMTQLPTMLVEGAFRAVDYVLIPWYSTSHFSTIVIINLRTP